jgi:7-cyano-7-deazaguanine reductase
MENFTAKGEKLGLKHLGNKSPYVYDDPQIGLLESVPSPFVADSENKHKVVGTVHIEALEFTSLCPITGQPDFGKIMIDYRPNEKCVESKSLKLYLGAYRQLGAFQESIVNKIANDLIELLQPVYLKVEGQFTARGGITLTPRAEYQSVE